MTRALVAALLLAVPARAHADDAPVHVDANTVVIHAEPGSTVNVETETTTVEDAAPAPQVACTPGAPAMTSPDSVGHRTCTRFGQWAASMRVPPIFLDWGMAGRSVALPRSILTARIAGASAPTGHALAPAVTTVFRMGVGLRGGAYAGLETEIGGVGGDAEMTPPPGMAAPGPALFFGGYFVLGMRGALGRASLAAELAAGGRLVQLEKVGGYGMPSEPGAIDGEGVVEARARAELWLSPWVSGGITVGTGLLQRDEVMGGAYFSLHTRAFGGDRAGRR